MPIKAKSKCEMMRLPTCDLCHKPHDEIYDSPIVGAGGSWGYICGTCVALKGTIQAVLVQNLGCQIILLNEKQPMVLDVEAEERWANEIDIEDLTQMVMGSKNCYAMDGCLVESDGKCVHGFRSPLVILGIN